MQNARYLRAFTLSTLGAFWALPLHAAEQGGGEMPQLDTSLYPEQLFWLAVSFGLLYVMMKYVALPSVSETQDKRINTIETDLAAARAANDAAKATMAEYEKALAEARAKAQGMVGEIVAQASKESGTRQAAQKEQLAKNLAASEAKIAAARDAAVKEIKGSAAQLADLIVDRVLGIKNNSLHAAGER